MKQNNSKSIVSIILAIVALTSALLFGLISCVNRAPSGVTTSPDRALWGAKREKAELEGERPAGGFGGGGKLAGVTRSDQPLPIMESLVTFSKKRQPSEKQQSSKPGRIFAGTELMIIAREEELGKLERPGADETPGTGAMLVKGDTDQDLVPMPLKHTDVRAHVDGYISSVELTQQFHNPYDEKIEAVYVFPLPQDSAIHEFLMVIGERRIRGIIRERKEAERIYKEAKRQGYTASLLTQERPNIFTQSVANIEPGNDVDVHMTYFHTLPYMDGWYTFVFPMVVGPRFNPPGSTEGVGAVPRGAHGKSGQSTEVQYLKPDKRSGHDISLEVILNAGMTIEEAECPTHVVEKKSNGSNAMEVKLGARDRIPNRDFVLRYRVAGNRLKTGILTHRDERGGYFAFMLYPPEQVKQEIKQPLEMVFVLDCSGSMRGEPIAQAKAAVRRSLRQLQSNDTFQVIQFSNNASQLGRSPLEATPDNIARGLQYLDALKGSGGTMMIEGIKAALDFPHDEERLRFVVFLTDGYIGNEREILSVMSRKLGPARVFSFGVGSSVNRFLLERMAKMGRGVVAYLGLHEDPVPVMDQFMKRIRYPVLTDLKLYWAEGETEGKDVYPVQIPDLFEGRPVIVTGRFQSEQFGEPRITGRREGKRIELNLASSQEESGGEIVACKALPSIWARRKIMHLAELSMLEPSKEIEEEIQELALDYQLMSAYTSFVAVDSSRRTEGDHGTTVPVAVPVPEGVQYETTVKP